MPKMIIEMTPGEVHLVEHPTREPGKLSRWLSLKTASLSTRYNFAESSAGATTSNRGQYQAVVKSAFHLDPTGSYSIEGGLFPGNRFSGAGTVRVGEPEYCGQISI